MQTHTVTVQENEFKLLQAIQREELDPKTKELLIEQVIRHIEDVINARSLSPKEIMQLAPEERQKILTTQFQEAERFYKENSDILVPDVDAPIAY